MDRRLTTISKYLAKHLRHEPERIGVELDAHGWIEIDVLLTAAHAHGFGFSRAELEQVVADNDKQRYVIHDGRIRASQGHSIPVDLELPPAEPPAYLSPNDVWLTDHVPPAFIHFPTADPPAGGGVRNLRYG